MTTHPRRRFRTLNLMFFLPGFAAVGAFLIARQAQTWQQAVVLGLGVAAALLAFERWTADALAPVALPCLAVAAAVWPFGALMIDSVEQGAFFAITVVGSLIVPTLPRHRALAAFGLVGYVAAVGVLAVATTPQAGTGELIADVIVPTGVTATVTGLMFPNKRFYDVVAELEETRERDAELAVARERVRFAGDLHDIQGHTLHVAKLKIALAQKLIHRDARRAEQELREIHDLIGDTIARTRELAYGQRRLNLSVELENARNLLEAAGIAVQVDRCAEVTSPAIDLLAQVLRETTTNILRHSRATRAQIVLTAHSLTVVNDGVDETVLPQLHGLGALAQRVADRGGELTAASANGQFRTAATFPEQAS
ncbi:histidine kinase [Mycobacterium sp. ITM-2016-00317]|uniref:sensor histidine kinase n=1 Tax=Mycobacterium sp. ITM-2016-00317 TaxID=2099694 RepID=UPI00287F953C|nr:histidine kinase [Mycobacterium sp. ITM-2016-00317]WNG85580.1 histidine kinase [Mycobacterium sp. ITM-2016-00317]